MTLKGTALCFTGMCLMYNLQYFFTISCSYSILKTLKGAISDFRCFASNSNTTPFLQNIQHSVHNIQQYCIHCILQQITE